MKPNRPVRMVAGALGLAAMALATHVGAQTANTWRPIFVDKKGKESEFPVEAEKIAKLQDKDWLRVRYTEFKGFKPRLAVVLSDQANPQALEYNSEFVRFLAATYGAEAQRPMDGFYQHAGDGMRQSLGATNRYTIVERGTAIDDVIGEQDLGASGRVDAKSAAQRGRIKGVDFIIKANVLAFDPEKEAKEISGLGGALTGNSLGLGSVGIKGTVAWVRLNVRAINAQDATVVADVTVDGTAASKKLSGGGGILGLAGGVLGGGGISGSSETKASMDDAVAAACAKAVYILAKKLETVEWKGAVAKVNGHSVIIDAGKNIGLSDNLELLVRSRGDAITDPADSTVILGWDSKDIGKVRIVNAQDKFSICEVVMGCDSVKVNDIVVLQSARN